MAETQVVTTTTPAAIKVAITLTGTVNRSHQGRLTPEGANPEAVTETMAMMGTTTTIGGTTDTTTVGGTTCLKGQMGCKAPLYLTTKPTVPSSHAKKPKY